MNLKRYEIEIYQGNIVNLGQIKWKHESTEKIRYLRNFDFCK